MSRNFKEALLFTTLMCAMMVLGMSMWNLFIVGQLSLHHLTIGYIPGFITAFLLDVILVGPIVKSIAFRILKDHHKRWQKIITIYGRMAVLMVTFMSFYGLFYNGIAITPKTYLMCLDRKLYCNSSSKLPNCRTNCPFYTKFFSETISWGRRSWRFSRWWNPNYYLSHFCKLLTFEIPFLLGYNGRNEFLRGSEWKN